MKKGTMLEALAAAEWRLPDLLLRPVEAATWVYLDPSADEAAKHSMNGEGQAP